MHVVVLAPIASGRAVGWATACSVHPLLLVDQCLPDQQGVKGCVCAASGHVGSVAVL